MSITKLEQLNPEVVADFIKLVNEAKGFEKKGKASFGKTKYDWVLLDDILEYIKSSDNWAVIQPMGTNVEGRAAIKTVLIHKSGNIIQTDWVDLGYKDTDTSQEKGIKDTYTRRYLLGTLLGIAVGSDNDGKLEDKTDEEKAKEIVEANNKKAQAEITKLFDELVQEYASKEVIYHKLGTNRKDFTVGYYNRPLEILEQLERVFKGEE